MLSSCLTSCPLPELCERCTQPRPDPGDQAEAGTPPIHLSASPVTAHHCPCRRWRGPAWQAPGSWHVALQGLHDAGIPVGRGTRQVRSELFRRLSSPLTYAKRFAQLAAADVCASTVDCEPNRFLGTGETQTLDLASRHLADLDGPSQLPGLAVAPAERHHHPDPRKTFGRLIHQPLELRDRPCIVPLNLKSRRPDSTPPNHHCIACVLIYGVEYLSNATKRCPRITAFQGQFRIVQTQTRFQPPVLDIVSPHKRLNRRSELLRHVGKQLRPRAAVASLDSRDVRRRRGTLRELVLS